MYYFALYVLFSLHFARTLLFSLHFARTLLTKFLQSEVKIIHIIVQDQDGQNNNNLNIKIFEELLLVTFFS
jgi:hypothetical protein